MQAIVSYGLNFLARLNLVIFRRIL